MIAATRLSMGAAAPPATVPTAGNAPALPPRRGAMRRVLPAIAGALAFGMAGALSSARLPTEAGMALPALAFLAGILLAHRRTRQAVAAAPADRRDANAVERAAAEPRELAEDGACPVAMSPEEPYASNVVPLRRTPLHVQRASAELAQYHTFTDILSHQLTSVTTVSAEAGTSILANLSGVDDKIGSLLSFIQQSGSNERVAAVVTQIEAQMQGCTQMLDVFAANQQAEVERKAQHRFKLASDTKGVLNVLESVHGIARQTTMLSLNVSIEAARAGEAGRGFSVIAHEIRKLATEVQNLATEVQSRVKTLMNAVTVDLDDEIKLRNDSEATALLNIQETLSALTDNLMSLITHQRDVLSKVETENEAIAQPLLEIMGSIQFQDIIRQQLEQLDRTAATVGEHMAAIGRMLDAGADELGEETLSRKLDAMFNGYVMESQRATHQAAQGRAASQDTSARIELF